MFKPCKVVAGCTLCRIGNLIHVLKPCTSLANLWQAAHCSGDWHCQPSPDQHCPSHAQVWQRFHLLAGGCPDQNQAGRSVDLTIFDVQTHGKLQAKLFPSIQAIHYAIFKPYRYNFCLPAGARAGCLDQNQADQLRGPDQHLPAALETVGQPCISCHISNNNNKHACQPELGACGASHIACLHRVWTAFPMTQCAYRGCHIACLR